MEPRGRRVVEGGRPLCLLCLTTAGLLDVDDLLAASAELEDRLSAVLEHGEPLAAESLLGVAGRIVAAARAVALDHLVEP